MDRRRYSEEEKAAVMAALLAGQSVDAVAAQYQIPAGTIKCWQHRQQGCNPVATVATEKRERIGDLILEYLVEMLTTLKEQAVFARDKEWLKKQVASEFAVLHGVGADKVFRLLEAIGRPDGDEGAPPDLP